MDHESGELLQAKTNKIALVCLVQDSMSFAPKQQREPHVLWLSFVSVTSRLAVRTTSVLRTDALAREIGFGI